MWSVAEKKLAACRLEEWAVGGVMNSLAMILLILELNLPKAEPGTILMKDYIEVKIKENSFFLPNFN